MIPLIGLILGGCRLAVKVMRNMKNAISSVRVVELAFWFVRKILCKGGGDLLLQLVAHVQTMKIGVATEKVSQIYQKALNR